MQVLIYVFDVESRELEKDYRYYQSCLEALLQNSPHAKVFCLIHKMDLVLEEHRDQASQSGSSLIHLICQVFADKERDIARLSEAAGAGRVPLQCFRSSIWDETLYKAWSAIVYQLIPNVGVMEQRLMQLASHSTIA